MNKKKSINPILKILAVLFVIFLALFIANASGYYESKIRDNMMVTEEGIKEFEEKVKKGEEIDISSFLHNERVDYSNGVSHLGDSLTNGIETFVSDGMKYVANIIKSLF